MLWLYSFFRSLAKELLKTFMLKRSNHDPIVMRNVSVCNKEVRRRVEYQTLLSSVGLHDSAWSGPDHEQGLVLN